MKNTANKQYAFLDFQGNATPGKTTESKGLSEEISLAIAEIGLTPEDMKDLDNAKEAVNKLYEEGFRPTIFVPADKYEDLALELTGYGTKIPHSQGRPKIIVNANMDNTMVHNTKKSILQNGERGLVTLGRTPYMQEAGYIVEIDVPKENIAPLLTGKDGFSGVVALKSTNILPEQMRVLKVVGPAEGKTSLMKIQTDLRNAIQELES